MSSDELKIAAPPALLVTWVPIGPEPGVVPGVPTTCSEYVPVAAAVNLRVPAPINGMPTSASPYETASATEASGAEGVESAPRSVKVTSYEPAAEIVKSCS